MLHAEIGSAYSGQVLQGVLPLSSAESKAIETRIPAS